MNAIPPHSLEAERSVLGAILLTGELPLSIVSVDMGLRPEHFFRDTHAAVYAAMLELSDRQRPIDVLTVTEHLKMRGQLEQAGGELAVDELAGWVPAAGHLREYARVVLEYATWRQRQIACYRMLEAVVNRDQGAFDIAEAEIASGDRPDESTSTPEELASDLFDWLGTEGTGAIHTPFPDLNDFLSGGLRPGDVSLIAGWSYHGKSLLCNGLLEYAASSGHACHLYMNEMAKRDRMLRTVATVSGVPFSRLMRKDLDDRARDRVIAALSDLPPVGITDCSGWSGQDIARHIRRHRWELAALDHVHLVPHRDVKELDAISAALNAAARQADCHLLLVCQLNMERYKTAKKPRPTQRDIRGTGQLYNDAANVLMLYRDQDMIEAPGQEPIYELSSNGSIYLEKAKNGTLGGVKVVLNGARMRFEEEHFDAPSARAA